MRHKTTISKRHLRQLKRLKNDKGQLITITRKRKEHEVFISNRQLKYISQKKINTEDYINHIIDNKR